MTIQRPAIKVISVLMLVGAGVAAGMMISRFLAPTDTTAGDEPGVVKAPLYWVAPMDPNFRRDKPGKSPMGMDLVPVYPEDGNTDGVVSISPAVVHNIGVRTGVVRRGVLQQEVTTVAFVQYDEHLIANVHPRVEGWLKQLHVKTVGEDVRAGQPLFELYSPALVSAQEEYLTALESGNRILISAGSQRLRSLHITPAQVEVLGQDRKVNQSVTIYAEQAGVVTDLGVREGSFVTPGTRVLGLAALDTVWVTAEIFESEIATIKAGDMVELRFVHQPERIYRAGIEFIYPALDAATRTVRVRVQVPNPDRLLKPNMFADATIRLASDREAILVPRAAVIRTGAQNRVVLVMAEGTYKSIAVTLGRMSDTEIEIQEGLAEGDRVVTSAQFLIDSESSLTSDFKRLEMAEAEAGDGTREGHDHD